jgi:hypothetical protein
MPRQDHRDLVIRKYTGSANCAFHGSARVMQADCLRGAQSTPQRRSQLRARLRVRS